MLFMFTDSVELDIWKVGSLMWVIWITYQAAIVGIACCVIVSLIICIAIQAKVTYSLV